MTLWTKTLAAVAFALVFIGHIPNTSAEQTLMAQAQPEEETYLPPWQGEEDSGSVGSDGYDSGTDSYEPESAAPPRQGSGGDYGDPYDEEPPRSARRYDDGHEAPPQRYDVPPRHRYDEDENYTPREIVDAGHRFFGTVTEGLARVVEYAFSRQGYPNGYILGEEAGGAFVAGLRYGEGTLYTKHIGRRKVFWQGPSIGYDFGAEGSKTMILVYDIQHPAEIYHRFGGVDGSAYFVGGVGITFQRHGEVVLAPIRSGVGLRLGANVGYLKYTREPTWNPF